MRTAPKSPIRMPLRISLLPLTAQQSFWYKGRLMVVRTEKSGAFCVESGMVGEDIKQKFLLKILIRERKERRRLAIPAGSGISLGDLAHRLAGVAHGNAIGRNILYNNAAAANHNIIANRNTGHNLHPRTEPDIIAYFDGVCVFQPLIAAGKIDRVTRSVKTAHGADKHIMPEGYAAGI